MTSTRAPVNRLELAFPERLVRTEHGLQVTMRRPADPALLDGVSLHPSMMAKLVGRDVPNRTPSTPG